MRSIASAQKANDPIATHLAKKLRDLRAQPVKKSPYDVVCETSTDISAEIYPLDPSNLHPQIAWAAAEIEALFTGQPYPGDYNMPKHPDGFRVVRADLDQLPSTIQGWIEGHPGQKSFCVVEGVVFFAPGGYFGDVGVVCWGGGEGSVKVNFPQTLSAEIGRNLFFKAVARKQIKEDVQSEESPGSGDTVDGIGYQLGSSNGNGRGSKPTKDEL
ncbi:hypothetical protein N7481_012683 [Penicillium waksmanii]|uniref:uncharacterized protein n=1 Tax=Penicillium waksmanii TaxID=69791 RepID=UPI002547A58F|nr:uncharacterized protein N7481_012683 [Penicillium waksmanii]KAJ5965969.1 hypothetical protein N7481_012683 [Penicillium waksmanii]